MQQDMKGKMADAYNYISGDLLCALLPLYVNGILRNTNKKKSSKWRHQTMFANFLVLTRLKCLLFSNKSKGVVIGQNAFTLNQGDTPLALIVSVPCVCAVLEMKIMNISSCTAQLTFLLDSPLLDNARRDLFGLLRDFPLLEFSGLKTEVAW